LKNEGKCRASGNIYEEMLEVVCIEAYNKIQRECLSGNFFPETKGYQSDSDKSLEILIYESIDQMKKADENRLLELQHDLDILINKRTSAEWETAPLDLSNYETEKIKNHFAQNPMPMTLLEIEPFKAVFARIVALEPGELKLILKNGNEIHQKYKPMRGQVKNAKENRGYTCKADKRT